MGLQLVGEPEGHADEGRLGHVIEEVAQVVPEGPGHGADDERGAGVRLAPEQEGRGEAAGHQVGAHPGGATSPTRHEAPESLNGREQVVTNGIIPGKLVHGMLNKSLNARENRAT
jgi:hypothetical protein